MVQERDGSNQPLASYVRGLDLSGSLPDGPAGAGGIGGLLARADHVSSLAGVSFYHADGNGNVTALINTNQQVVARYLYDPFGNVLGQSGWLADTNLYRFSSKEVHPASGLYYYGFRHYEPNLQRWLSRDPLGEAGGQNLYGFVGNDPTGYVDPDGEMPVLAAFAVRMVAAWALDQLYQHYILPRLKETIDANFECETQADLETALQAIEMARNARNAAKLAQQGFGFAAQSAKLDGKSGQFAAQNTLPLWRAVKPGELAGLNLARWFKIKTAVGSGIPFCAPVTCC